MNRTRTRRASDEPFLYQVRCWPAARVSPSGQLCLRKVSPKAALKASAKNVAGGSTGAELEAVKMSKESADDDAGSKQPERRARLRARQWAQEIVLEEHGGRSGLCNMS